MTSQKAVPYQCPVHMPSSSSCHTDDTHNFLHCTSLNTTHNNFHIYLWNILFCPHLLLCTAGRVLQCTLQVYHTVSNCKQQFINTLNSTYSYLINVEYRANWCKIKHLLSIDNTGNSSNVPMYFMALSCPIWHKQSVNSHKYYYYNLHNFDLILSCLTHTVSTQPQILLLQSTQFYHHILSCLTHTVSTQPQILLLQSTQFYGLILSCLTHRVSIQPQILLLQSTQF